MDTSILHVHQDFLLEVDFTPVKFLKALDTLTNVAVPFRNRMIDVTTSLGEYHYGLTISALQELFLEKEDVINCITIAENVSPGNVPTSLVVYIRLYNNDLKTSFTISSSSEEQNNILEELLIDQLEQLKVERAKSIGYSISDTFQFDQRIGGRELSKLILKIDERVFPEHEVEVDLLLKDDELILIGAEQIKLKNYLIKKDRKILCIHKHCDLGRSFSLFLFFEEDRSGFAYLEMTANTKGNLAQVKTFITQELQLNSRQLRTLRAKLANRPHLQQQFEIDRALGSDQIIDFLGKVSNRFLKEVEMELRFISPSHKAYCYSESDCKILREAFRHNRRGILVASKRYKDLYEVKVCINFRSLTTSVAYCYIALPTSQENVAAFKLLKEGLQPEERRLSSPSLSGTVIQDAFYFDSTISAGQMIWFIKMIDKEFLKDEVTNIRLTTMNGEKHYFYNEEYLDIIDLFDQKIHDSVYINKQTNDGQTITVNLQFHGQPGIPNCFYSINLSKKEEATLLKAKIIQILQNYQEEGPHLEEQPEENTKVTTEVALYLPDSNIRKELAGIFSDIGYRPSHVPEEKSGAEILDIIEDSELIVLDINQFNQRTAFMVGMARGIGKKTILLAEKNKRIPILFKGLLVLHCNYTEPDFEAIKSDLLDMLVT